MVDHAFKCAPESTRTPLPSSCLRRSRQRRACASVCRGVYDRGDLYNRDNMLVHFAWLCWLFYCTLALVSVHVSSTS
jgi:hypothetical protein